MRWTASAPVTWPEEADWQRVWAAVIAPVVTSQAQHDGLVRTRPGDPAVRLVAGSHLQPGAAYQIAPELRGGAMRGWVAEHRFAGVEWAPAGEVGRAHIEVHGLDRLQGAQVESTLVHLSGRAHLDLADLDRVLEAKVQLDWAAADLMVRVHHDRLSVEVAVRGRGAWRPTLAPMLTAASSRIQQSLEQSVRETADEISQLPSDPTAVLSDVRRPSLAERQSRHRPQIEAGMAQVRQRQLAVADAVDGVSWLGRTDRRWQAELDALPPAPWPEDDVQSYPTGWPGVESTVTSMVLERRRSRRRGAIDPVVATMTTRLLEASERFEKAVLGLPTTPGPPQPWLTDSALDLAWLTSPWSILRYATRRRP